MEKSGFFKGKTGKMGIRDGSFSHFSLYEKWEKEPSLIPIFSSAHLTTICDNTSPIGSRITRSAAESRPGADLLMRTSLSPRK